MKRNALNFDKAVLAQLGPVLAAFGFRPVAATSTCVRFRSSSVECAIDHAPFSYELSVSFSRLRIPDECYSLQDLVESEGGAESTFLQSSSVESVVHNVQFIARLLSRYGDRALRGNDQAFEDMLRVSRARNKKVTEMYVDGNARQTADVAWQAKDYAKVVALYESLESPLTSVEKRRVAYAKKQLGLP